ncbi:O-antigen ligase family protein [Nocardioides zeae]|uniref:O-antigen ligase-related domain-containing protein n=1 Tax=Nocardioides zeae TaxID=1457234 RepID=A0AAJ1X5I2_9ACTN|nr:O-antigen ligase family protein [Nocardioides zeae]MDQ1106747.1 hypothetical protein [Nocardioides zeae]
MRTLKSDALVWAATFFAVAIGSVLLAHDPAVTLSILVGAWVVGACLGSPRVAWVSLLVAVSLNGLSLPAGGVDVRFELIVLPVFLLSIVANGIPIRVPARILLPAAAYLSLLFFSSAAVAPVPAASLWIAVQIAGGVLLFVAVQSSHLDIERCVRDALRVMGAICSVALAALALARGGVLPPGQWGVAEDFRLIGFSIETNIFAAQCVGIVAVVLAARLKLESGDRLLFLIVCAAVVLAGTRSAWIALAVVIIIFALRDVLKRPARLLGAGLIGLGGLVLLPLATSQRRQVSEESLTWRLANLTNFDSGTGFYRLEIYRQAVDELGEWPRWLVGSGVNSYSQYHLIDATNRYAEYLGNFFLATLYDGGVLALVAFAVLIWSAMRENFNAGHVGVLLSVLICAAITNTIWFQFAWLYLSVGFAAASHRSHRRDEARINV